MARGTGGLRLILGRCRTGQWTRLQNAHSGGPAISTEAGPEKRQTDWTGRRGSSSCSSGCIATTQFLFRSSISSGFKVVKTGITGALKSPPPLRNHSSGAWRTRPPEQALASATATPRIPAPARPRRPTRAVPAGLPPTQPRAPAARAGAAERRRGAAPGPGAGRGDCCGAGRVASLRPPEPGCLRNLALGLWGAKCNPNPMSASPAQISTHKPAHRRRCARAPSGGFEPPAARGEPGTRAEPPLKGAT